MIWHFVSADTKFMGFETDRDFTGKNQGLWSHVSVQRILKKWIYTGTLIQGKTTTAA